MIKVKSNGNFIVVRNMDGKRIERNIRDVKRAIPISSKPVRYETHQCPYQKQRISPKVSEAMERGSNVRIIVYCLFIFLIS